ncbi:MAG: hypothetical protein PVG39_12795 [Desulfobacteraceae bacterium]|jgi:hypothetical protein
MGPKNSTIFISHRDSDKTIADIFNKTLRGWCDKQLHVFQSSDIREEGFKIGQELADTQREILSDASIVFLVFTSIDNDWLYCMWECGLATNSNGADSRIIVLQVGKDAPTALEDQIHITIDRDSVRRLVHDFHKEPGFFPGYNQALASELDEEEIEKRSDFLLDKLRNVKSMWK